MPSLLLALIALLLDHGRAACQVESGSGVCSVVSFSQTSVTVHGPQSATYRLSARGKPTEDGAEVRISIGDGKPGNGGSCNAAIACKVGSVSCSVRGDGQCVDQFPEPVIQCTKWLPGDMATTQLKTCEAGR